MVDKLKSNGKRLLLWFAVLAVYVIPILVVQGAFDTFLKIDGVPGEVTDAKHKDWIEVNSWSWGLSQSGGGATAGSGGRAGKVSVSDLSIMKRMDKSSPLLMRACCTGQHIKQVKVELCRSTGDKLPYMTYVMSDVLVTSLQPAGSSGGDDFPSESVSFNFAKIEWSYTPVDSATGQTAQPIKGGWDVIANKAP
jgi:type VI secretion system secreted protein Hcp